ncbi:MULTISPECIES: hypothetical protein [Aphanothece]
MAGLLGLTAIKFSLQPWLAKANAHTVVQPIVGSFTPAASPARSRHNRR